MASFNGWGTSFTGWDADQPAGAMYGSAVISFTATGDLTSPTTRRIEFLPAGASWAEKRDKELEGYDEEALMIALIQQHQELICSYI